MVSKRYVEDWGAENSSLRYPGSYFVKKCVAVVGLDTNKPFLEVIRDPSMQQSCNANYGYCFKGSIMSYLEKRSLHVKEYEYS